MPFRAFLVFRLLTPFPFGLALLNFVHVRHETARAIGAKALLVLVALTGVGVLLALVFLFTGVRFSCPFRGRWGPAAIEEKGRPWMECGTCGTIRCEGFLGLRIVKEP